MLLTHTGGLEAYAPLYRQARGRAEYLQEINARPLAYPPGTQTVYSDWDMVLLQAVIERIAGMSLDNFADGHLFRPLGMTRHAVPAGHDRAGLPAPHRPHHGGRAARRSAPGHGARRERMGDRRRLRPRRPVLLGARPRRLRAAPARRRHLRQHPHRRAADDRALDVAPGQRTASRALGWDTPAPSSSAGRYFSPRSFGHTGFTGTSLWIDPERGLFVVLLMNRVNSRGEATRHVQLRRDVSDAVQRAVLDAPLVDWEECAAVARRPRVQAATGRPASPWPRPGEPDAGQPLRHVLERREARRERHELLHRRVRRRTGARCPNVRGSRSASVAAQSATSQAAAYTSIGSSRSHRGAEARRAPRRTAPPCASMRIASDSSSFAPLEPPVGAAGEDLVGRVERRVRGRRRVEPQRGQPRAGDVRRSRCPRRRAARRAPTSPVERADSAASPRSRSRFAEVVERDEPVGVVAQRRVEAQRVLQRLVRRRRSRRRAAR